MVHEAKLRSKAVGRCIDETMVYAQTREPELCLQWLDSENVMKHT